MKPKQHRALIITLSVIDIIAIIGAVLLAAIPPSSKLQPPNTSPMMVILSFPSNHSSWPADTSIPIAADAVGQNITRLELWIDGALFNAVTPEHAGISAYQSWFWMPTIEGKHAFFVRATDALGRTADSNVTHITATPASGFVEVVTALGGEKLADLAVANGTTLEAVEKLNSTLNPQDAIAAGTQVNIPLDIPGAEPPLPAEPDQPQTGESTTPGSEAHPNGMGLVFGKLFGSDPFLPSAPELSVSVQNCDVKLSIQDNSDPENGFYIYLLNESDTSFHRIITLNPHAGKGLIDYSIPKLFGQVQFYVSAFNAAGEAPGNPVEVNVTTADCAPGAVPAGKVTYANGFLTIPQGMDLAYFYASINGSDWRRVPEGKSFFTPQGGKVDIREQVKALMNGNTSIKANLEVWGWKQTELVYLGQVSIDLNFSSLAVCNLGNATSCSGDVASTFWVESAVVGSDKANTNRAFRWRAYGPDITYALWQISTKPFPVEYSIAAFPGLVLTGVSNAEINSQTGMAGGDFEVDFKTDLNIPSIESSADQGNKRLGFLNPNGFDIMEFQYFDLRPAQLLGPNLFNAMLTKTLYVRVVPMSGGHPASEPSNIVDITYTPTGEPPEVKINAVPTFTVEVLPDTFTAERAVVQKMGVMGCSMVDGVDHDVFVENWKQNHQGMAWSMFDPEVFYNQWVSLIGKTLCPPVVELEDPAWYEELWGALTEAWNQLTNAFNMIKASLVEALAYAIPGCDATCKVVLSTGLNFAITYFTGIPPTLPNFDEIVEKGIGYAVEQAISAAGIPYCDAVCRELITKGITEAADEMKYTKPSPGCVAQNGTYWLYEGATLYHLKPLCFPPGIATTPIKGSVSERATVQIRVKRTDGSPESIPSELLVIDSFAINTVYGDGHSSTEYARPAIQYATDKTNYQYTMTYSEPLEGAIYPKMGVTVPGISTGIILDIPVIFDYGPGDFKNIGYPSRSNALQTAFPDKDLSFWSESLMYQDYKHLNDQGTQVMIMAHVVCSETYKSQLYTSPCSNLGSLIFTITQDVAAPIAVPAGE